MNETWRTYGVLQLLETVHWARTIFQIQLRNYCLQIIFLHHCVNAILNKTSYINLYQDQNQGWWIVLFSNHKTNSRPVFTCYISLQQKHQTFIHCTFLSVCSFQNTEQVQWHTHTQPHTHTIQRDVFQWQRSMKRTFCKRRWNAEELVGDKAVDSKRELTNSGNLGRNMSTWELIYCLIEVQPVSSPITILPEKMCLCMNFLQLFTPLLQAIIIIIILFINILQYL